MIISRTGYTGELGYELYLPSDQALAIWEKLAADERVEPVGLGARTPCVWRSATLSTARIWTRNTRRLRPERAFS